MKILFDQGVPVPLRRHLPGHMITTAHEQGWSNLTNGRLLSAAQQDGYQLLLTTDQNLRYQQNLADRQLSIIVLRSTSWPRIQRRQPIDSCWSSVSPFTELSVAFGD